MEVKGTELVAVVVVVAIASMAGGYVIAGGPTRVKELYTYGENIWVNVKVEDLGIEKRVQLYRGMTALDALAKTASFKAEYYEAFGTSIVTEIGGIVQNWGYKVNGESPLVGVEEY